jgi:DNA gyrase/topoisomerase IV subunit B
MRLTFPENIPYITAEGQECISIYAYPSNCSGSNFSTDDTEKISAGMNGSGAKITNILSKIYKKHHRTIYLNSDNHQRQKQRRNQGRVQL